MTEPSSAEASRDLAREGGPKYARVARQPRDQYVPGVFMGTQRAPREEDEAGAICVVDLLFGGRVVVYEIGGDSKHRRVETRP